MRKIRRSACGLLFLSLSAAVAARPLPVAICDENQKVNKERLAMAALAEAGVSPYPYSWVVTRQLPLGQTPAQYLLSEEEFCSATPATKNGIPRCGKDDQERLGAARNIVLDVLFDRTGVFVRSPEAGSVSAFFRNASATVSCGSTGGSVAQREPLQGYPAPFDFKRVPLRLRGSTDGLHFDRSVDEAFNGVEKASFSFKSDDAKGKDTRTAAAVLGLVLKPIPRVFELVPYVGYALDSSKKDGEEEEVTIKSRRVGVLADFRTRSPGLAHILLVRPEYGWNRKDRIELVSGTLGYVPLVTGYVNDAINIAPGGRSLLTIVPRAELRLVGGHFARAGERTEEESRDFLRAGALTGVTLTSDIKWLPVEVSVLQTYLVGVSGRKNDLSHLKGVLSFYFDEKKLFGVDLAYARGRKDDLLEREENWTFGLGAKF